MKKFGLAAGILLVCVIGIFFAVHVAHKNGSLFVQTSDQTFEKTPDQTFEETMDQAPAWESQVVSVSFGAGSGNGVILEKNEEYYILCTAAHVAGSEPGEGSVAGSPVVVQEYYISPNVDVAFLKIPADALEEKEAGGLGEDDGGNLSAGLDSTAYNELKEGDPICIFGFLGGERQIYEGQVLSCWVYMEDFGYHMLWGQAAEVKNGMSGSGVFDEEERLIGILCGGDGADQVAVLPISIIEAEWKNSGCLE